MSAPTRTPFEDLGLSTSCVEVLRHLWDYLDDEMTLGGAHRLEAHIATCPTCRDYQGYQSCFLDALARLRSECNAPITLRERLAEKLKGQGCGCWDKVKKEQP